MASTGNYAEVPLAELRLRAIASLFELVTNGVAVPTERALKTLGATIVPEDPNFSGEGSIDFQPLVVNHGYTSWICRTVGVFKDGQLKFTFEKVISLASFKREWRNPLISGVLTTVVARIAGSNAMALALVLNRTAAAGAFLRASAGGFTCDKAPGNRDGYRRRIPGVLSDSGWLSQLEPWHHIAFAEAREEVADVAFDWSVVTGTVLQEPYNATEVYGTAAVGITVASESELLRLRGSAPDISQGKTYWANITPDGSPAPYRLIQAGRRKNLPDGSQGRVPVDANSRVAIDNLADLWERHAGHDNAAPWDYLAKNFAG